MPATIIGSITLDNEMRWIDELQYEALASSSVRTLAGGLYRTSRALSAAGRPITLQGSEKDGWQLGTTIAALRALAFTQGLTLPVYLGGTTYQCRFRQNMEGNGVAFKRVNDSAPLSTQAYFTGTEKCFGTIYLETV